MIVCYSGDLAGRMRRSRRSVRSGEPVVDLLQERPYAEMQSFLDATEPKGNH